MCFGLCFGQKHRPEKRPSGEHFYPPILRFQVCVSIQILTPPRRFGSSLVLCQICVNTLENKNHSILPFVFSIMSGLCHNPIECHIPPRSAPQKPARAPGPGPTARKIVILKAYIDMFVLNTETHSKDSALFGLVQPLLASVLLTG